MMDLKTRKKAGKGKSAGQQEEAQGPALGGQQEAPVESSNAFALERLKQEPTDGEEDAPEGPQSEVGEQVTADGEEDAPEAPQAEVGEQVNADEEEPPPEEEAPTAVIESESEVEEEEEEEPEVATETEEACEVDEGAEAEEKVETEAEEDAGAEEADQAAAALEDSVPPPTPMPVPAPAPAPQPATPQAPQKGVITPEKAPDPFIEELFEGYSGHTPEEHAAMASDALAGLSQVLGTGQTEVDAHASNLCGQIDSAIEGRVANLWSAFDGASATLSAGFTTARANVEGFAATAFGNIESAAADALARVVSSETAQLQALDQGFESELTRLDGISDAAVTSFTAAFESQVQAIRDVGNQKAEEALSIGSSMSAAYAGRGGDGIEGKRNQARADAALRVAEDYAVGIREKGDEIANEVAEGAANIPEIVTQMVEPVVEQLSTVHTEAQEGLADAAETGRTQIEDQKTTAIEGLEQTRSQAMSTLDEQESSSLADLRSMANTFEQNLRGAGDGLKEQILKAASDLGARFAEAAAVIQGAVADSEMPNGPDVQQVCADASSQFESEKVAHLSLLDEVAQGGLTDLDSELSAACSGLQQSADQAVTSAHELANELGQGLLESAEAFATGVDELATTLEGAFEEMVAGALEGAASCVDQTETGLQEQEQEIVSGLESVVTEVDSALGESLSELPGQIEAEAEAAASKIQPWWKKAIAAVVSIAVAIVVTIAVTAFVMATFGAGAAVLAAIIAGAAAGLASTFASDATMSLLTWSNQFSSWETYLIAGVSGAVLGGLGNWTGGLIAKSGVGTKIAHGVGMSFAGSTLDQVFDMTVFGESWNWSEWLIGGSIGGAVNGLNTRFMPKSFGNGVRDRIFSKGGNNTWNNFQREFARVPGLSGSQPGARAEVYRLVASEAGGVPKDLVNHVISQLGWKSDPDKKTPSPEEYEGDGSQVQVRDIEALEDLAALWQ